MSRSARLVIVIIITTFFFLFEFIIGNYSKSLSLTADAFTCLSDLISQVVGLVAIRINKKPPQRSEFTFGWARAEILGAIINSVFQLALCFTIIVNALGRFMEPEEIKNPKLVFWIGIAGFIGNMFSLCLCVFNTKKIKGFIKEKLIEFRSKRNSKGSNPSLESDLINESNTHIIVEEKDFQKQTKKDATMNMQGVFLHVLGDALGSFGVIITTAFVLFTDIPHKELIDPFVSLIIVGMLLATTIPLLKKSALILLQTAPISFPIDEFRQEIKGVKGVRSIHNLHIWQLNELDTIATLQVLCKPDAARAPVVLAIRKIMHKHDITQTTIQVEVTDPEVEDEEEITKFS